MSGKRCEFCHGSGLAPPEHIYTPADLFGLVGQTLRAERKKRHITLEMLAKSSGVSLGYISQLELGKNQASIAAYLKLTAALGLRLSDLLRDAEDQLTSLSTPAEVVHVG